MRSFFTKKRSLIALAAFVALAIAGGAFASFTSTGSGTGAGAVGTAGTWTVTGASESGNLYPFLQTDLTANSGLYTPLTGGTVQNSGSGRQTLQQIVATISSVTGGQTVTGETACAVTDFRLYSPTGTWTLSNSNDTATINPGADLAPHGTTGDTYTMGDLSIAMVDHGALQDDCQGATPHISYSAS